MLFIGEERSELVVKMGVTWEDGRLAAKQLFDALIANDVDPATCKFINWFEDGEQKVRNYKGPRIALGRKVQDAMTKAGLDFIACVHPAARGTIRKKENYTAHIKEVLAHV